MVSGDGRLVAFSTRNEFVVGGDAGLFSDILRLNLRTGRYVGFSSFAGNLVASDLVPNDTNELSEVSAWHAE